MTTIIPRWEWRTFGRGVEVAEPHVANLTSTGVQESDETYLLAGTRNTAKIRAGLMDIKVLVEVNPDGLEQWRPAMKAEFPLSAGEVTTASNLSIATIPWTTPIGTPAFSRLPPCSMCSSR